MNERLNNKQARQRLGKNKALRRIPVADAGPDTLDVLHLLGSSTFTLVLGLPYPPAIHYTNLGCCFLSLSDYGAFQLAVCLQSHLFAPSSTYLVEWCSVNWGHALPGSLGWFLIANFTPWSPNTVHRLSIPYLCCSFPSHSADFTPALPTFLSPVLYSCDSTCKGHSLWFGESTGSMHPFVSNFVSNFC